MSIGVELQKANAPAGKVCTFQRCRESAITQRCNSQKVRIAVHILPRLNKAGFMKTMKSMKVCPFASLPDHREISQSNQGNDNAI